MKNPLSLFLSSLSVAAVSLCAFSQDGIVVQDPSLSVRWQTAVDPSSPLTWCWDDADSARMTCSRPGGGVEVLDIKRGKDNDGVDDALGECVVPVPQEFVSGSEYLYDVTLELFSGEKAVRSESARIAFLPGIAAGGMTLREPDSVGWRKIKDARLFAYPPAATPEIVVEKDSSPVSRRELDAAGGFDVVLPYADMSRHGPLAVSVQSGGEKLLEAELRHYALRMPVIVR